MKLKRNIEIEMEIRFPWHKDSDLVLSHNLNDSMWEEEEVSFESVLKETLDGLTPEEEKIVKAKIAASVRKFLELLEA